MIPYGTTTAVVRRACAHFRKSDTSHEDRARHHMEDLLRTAFFEYLRDGKRSRLKRRKQLKNLKPGKRAQEVVDYELADEMAQIVVSHGRGKIEEDGLPVSLRQYVDSLLNDAIDAEEVMRFFNPDRRRGCLEHCFGERSARWRPVKASGKSSSCSSKAVKAEETQGCPDEGADEEKGLRHLGTRKRGGSPSSEDSSDDEKQPMLASSANTLSRQESRHGNNLNPTCGNEAQVFTNELFAEESHGSGNRNYPMNLNSNQVMPLTVTRAHSPLSGAARSARSTHSPNSSPDVVSPGNIQESSPDVHVSII